MVVIVRLELLPLGLLNDEGSKDDLSGAEADDEVLEHLLVFWNLERPKQVCPFTTITGVGVDFSFDYKKKENEKMRTKTKTKREGEREREMVFVINLLH